MQSDQEQFVVDAALSSNYKEEIARVLSRVHEFATLLLYINNIK